MDSFNSDGGEAGATHREGLPSIEGDRWVEGYRRQDVPYPWLGEAVLFTDFHEHGFVILASDFLRGFLREYGV